MFSLDGPLYRVLTFLYRLMVMNLLYLVSCIFIITIPAATAALFATVRKSVQHEEPAILRTYLRAMKENLFQSYVVFAFLLVAFFILWLDLRVLTTLHHFALKDVSLVLLYIVGFIVLSTAMNIFPLMVHLNQSTKQLFSNALKLNFVKPYLTFANLIVQAAWFLITSRELILVFGFYFSVCAYMVYFVANQRFKALSMVHEEQGTVQNDHEFATTLNDDGETSERV